MKHGIYENHCGHDECSFAGTFVLAYEETPVDIYFYTPKRLGRPYHDPDGEVWHYCIRSSDEPSDYASGTMEPRSVGFWNGATVENVKQYYAKQMHLYQIFFDFLQINKRDTINRDTLPCRLTKTDYEEVYLKGTHPCSPKELRVAYRKKRKATSDK